MIKIDEWLTSDPDTPMKAISTMLLIPFAIVAAYLLSLPLAYGILYRPDTSKDLYKMAEMFYAPAFYPRRGLSCS